MLEASESWGAGRVSPAWPPCWWGALPQKEWRLFRYDDAFLLLVKLGSRGLPGILDTDTARGIRGHLGLCSSKLFRGHFTVKQRKAELLSCMQG